MVKKKLAFVDHNYHKKTRCADFLREIFSEHFIIDDYWWSLSEETKLIKYLKNYENIFFFQTLIPSYDLLKLRNKNLMWAPMYGNLPFDWKYWIKIKYTNIKILCFSNKVKLHADKLGCQNIGLKYFIKPKEMVFKTPQKTLNIFFWYRNDLKLRDWIGLFDLNKINKIIYFDSPDPGRKSEEFDKITLDKYKIELIKISFLPHAEYIEYVKNCDVFISPRKQEGIGMSFLEAISMGKYIVSNDDSTMNEYIADKNIGFLINKKKKKSIDYNNIINSTNYRIQYAKNGYLQWLEQKKEITNFFLSNLTKRKKNWFTEILFFLDFVKFYLKKLFKPH